MSTPNGYTCICGQWVAWGVMHSCGSNMFPPNPPTYVAPMRAPVYGFRFVAADCHHCFCLATDKGDHERCCNCGVDRKRVVPQECSE